MFNVDPHVLIYFIKGLHKLCPVGCIVPDTNSNKIPSLVLRPFVDIFIASDVCTVFFWSQTAESVIQHSADCCISRVDAYILGGRMEG